LNLPQEPDPDKSGAQDPSENASETPAPVSGDANAAHEAGAAETWDEGPPGSKPGETGLAVSESAEAAEGEDVVTAWTPDPEKLFSALLFSSQEYLSGRILKEIMGDDWDVPSLRRLVKSVNKKFEEQEMPFEVAEVDGTFRIRTRTQYYPWVRKLFKDTNPRRLSQASLETLAIIAYKQPITKAEIESIRGVNVDGCMKSLLEKKLVDVNGRTDAMGGAFSYSTTREFMRYFGINRVPDDLPRLSEFEAIVNAQALIPQIASDGTIVEVSQEEPDGEQMSLDTLE
jgi:segregation and condensation protein B